MVHILLMILKVIGIVLLILLSLILLLLISVLFVPVRYDGKIQKKRQGMENLSVSGRISWMFGGVALRFSWKNQHVKSSFRILGVTVYPAADSAKKKNKNGKNSIRESERDSSITEKDPVTGYSELSSSVQAERKEDKETEKGQNTEEMFREKDVRFPGNLFRKLSGCFQSVCSLVGKLIGIPHRISRWVEKTGERLKKWKQKLKEWKKFLSSESFRQGSRLVLHEMRTVLKALKPRKLRGEVRFGFEDPAETGQVLGLISLLYPVFPDGFRIVPVFEHSVFLADFCLAGRIHGITLMRVLWHLYRDRNIRIIYRKFQHKEA